MRAGELGVQDEAEMGVKLTLLFSDSYVPVRRNKDQNVSKHLQLLWKKAKFVTKALLDSRHFDSQAAITCSVSSKINISFYIFSSLLSILLLSTTTLSLNRVAGCWSLSQLPSSEWKGTAWASRQLVTGLPNRNNQPFTHNHHYHKLCLLAMV